MTELKLEETSFYSLNDEQKQKLNDISEIQMHLLETVHDHNESINRIEYNLSSINSDLDSSVDNLESANQNYLLYSPIIGSIVGAIMVSPIIGLVGLKTGSIASLTGGVVGAISGYKIQEI